MFNMFFKRINRSVFSFLDQNFVQVTTENGDINHLRQKCVDKT